jgi:hypothetical protein
MRVRAAMRMVTDTMSNIEPCAGGKAPSNSKQADKNSHATLEKGPRRTFATPRRGRLITAPWMSSHGNRGDKKYCSTYWRTVRCAPSRLVVLVPIDAA